MTDEHNPNRTVFKPSPLQSARQAPAVSPTGGDPLSPAPDAAPRLPDDDIPLPSSAPVVRNVMMAKAAPLLALAASVRSGRAGIEPPRLHAQATQMITTFDQAVVAAGYPDEQRQRGKYGLCATIDDIAQNLPGADGAEWARHSLVVQFFQEAIGGDRFWQLVDDMLARPAQSADLIELYHACLAAGFEGRMRVAPDGKRRLHEIMTSLYAALPHVRSISPVELSPHWRGQPTPRRKVGFWSILALAAGVAFAALLTIYIILRLVLLQTGAPAMTALRAINPGEPLRLSRVAPPPPATTSGQLQTLKAFLAPEIAQHLVVVEEDGSTVRVRTTVGQLFASGSDSLQESAKPLFGRIGAAIETQPGAVKVNGYTDSDKVGTLSFPDNIALSKARADVVAAIVKSRLSNPGRVTSEGFGDADPVASNASPAGKSLNRRVEIVVPRTS
jgi:type VI secretion system protein ImpK